MSEVQIKAQAKFIRGSARKVRIVADAVRGMNAVVALYQLKYMHKASALRVAKVLKSAINNATHNEGLDAENLVISEIRIDDAPVFKRMRRESKGRSRSILKRNSHINIVLTQKGERAKVTEVASAEAKAAKAPAAAAKSTKKTDTKPTKRAKKA